MRHRNMKKPIFGRYTAALLLSLSLSIVASCSGDHGNESHQDIANKATEHSGGHSKETSGVSGQTATEAGHDSKHMMADTVMATVLSVDVANRQLALDHEELPSIGMAAMAMDFNLDDGVAVAGVKKNDKVEVTVAMKPGKGLVITEVKVVE